MKSRGFTLAEVMVAMLFVSIALFGYVALHLRILHSASTLQLRHSIRRKVDLHMGVLIGQAKQDKLPKNDGVLPLFLDQGTQEMITPYILPSGDQPGNQYEGRITLETQVDCPKVRHLSLQIDWNNQHGAQSYVVDTFHATKDAGW
ncbi:MAG: prepilin-type N-terminal cleavage/methylation domain-containing protein [Candidatus Eremiobacteraeota bacterium]|nr:prepilin-type N-terminal cleavage/methylation domain-containing protein [Candidatus Eremiobacteraeota bacterium]